LRRLAFVLALALPGLFMAVAAALYLREPGPVYFDFDVNHRAALLLCGSASAPGLVGTCAGQLRRWLQRRLWL
jgi:hypothetical protein